MSLCRRNGILYLWHVDDQGHRRKVATHSRTKPGALQFPQSFRSANSCNDSVLPTAMLSQVLNEYIEYSKGIHTQSTHTTYLDTLNQFFLEIGDNELHRHRDDLRGRGLTSGGQSRSGSLRSIQQNEVESGVLLRRWTRSAPPASCRTLNENQPRGCTRPCTTDSSPQLSTDSPSGAPARGASVTTI